MDQILTQLAIGYFANFTTPMIINFFKEVFKRKPELRDQLESATTTQDIEEIFRKAIDVIDAQAGSGSIDVDGAILDSLRGIRFDHNSGTVMIQGTKMEAPVLQTGGTGSGKTHIGENTILKTKGTSISVGKGCSITMTGNSKITQT